MYEYHATLVRVVDGDTIIADVDLGFRIHQTMSVRLAGINAPEPRGETRQAGMDASSYLASMVRLRQALVLHTERERGKFGRYVAVVYLMNGDGDEGVNLNEAMVKAGHAVRREY